MNSHRTIVASLFLGSLLAAGCLLPQAGQDETTADPPAETGTARAADTACPSSTALLESSGSTTRGPNRIEVFEVSGDGSIVHATYVAGVGVLPCDQLPASNSLSCYPGYGGAGGWERLGGIAASAPVATSWDANNVDLFVRGTDCALWHRHAVFSADGTTATWSPWESLGGLVQGSLAASSAGPGLLDVTITGSWGIYHIHYNGAWSSWEFLGDYSGA
jgi:hypothetical protein